MKPPPSARLIRGHRPAQNLVGAWMMGENGGLQVFDLSGNGNNGILTNGPIWVPGNTGPAVQFTSGSSQYIALDKVPLTTYPLTIISWYKTPAAGSVFGLTITDVDTENNMWGLQSNVGNYHVYYLMGGNSTFITWGSPLANTWYMVAGVSRASNDHELYVDSILRGTSSTNSTPTGLDNAKIGALGDSTPNYGDGINSVSLAYNYAFSASEIIQLYRESFCMFERKARTALMSGYAAPPVGAAGIMTTNAGYWGPTF